MADVFNLTADFDKTSYNPGDTMTVAVSGSVTDGNPTPVVASILITAADSSTVTLAASSAVNGSTETWVITSATDTAGRTWSISADGHSATATA